MNNKKQTNTLGSSEPQDPMFYFFIIFLVGVVAAIVAIYYLFTLFTSLLSNTDHPLRFLTILIGCIFGSIIAWASSKFATMTIRSYTDNIHLKLEGDSAECRLNDCLKYLRIASFIFAAWLVVSLGEIGYLYASNLLLEGSNIYGGALILIMSIAGLTYSIRQYQSHKKQIECRKHCVVPRSLSKGAL